MGRIVSRTYLRRVAAARQEFERFLSQSKAEFKITFDELLQLYQTKNLGLRSIAQKAGVSHETIRRLYPLFQDLCGGVSLSRRFELRKAYTYQAARQRLLRAVPEDSLLRTMMRVARLHDCRVLPIVNNPRGRGELYTLHHRILINGWRCATQRVRAVFQSRTHARRYVRVVFWARMLREAEAVVVWIDTDILETMLVIPKQDIINAFGPPESWRGGSVQWYIPAEGDVASEKFLFPITPYIHAWYLLTPKAASAKAA